MNPIYFPPSSRPPGSSVGVVVTAYTISTLTLLLPRSIPHRRLIPLPVYLYLLLYIRQHQFENLGEDYIIPIEITWLMIRWIDLVVCRDFDLDIYRYKQDGTRETGNEVNKLALWQKLKRSFGLLCSLRGIGWNWQVSHVDEVPKEESRRSFVRHKVLEIVKAYVLEDLTTFVLRRSLLGNPDISSIKDLPPSRQMVIVWSTAFRSGYEMCLVYHVLAILFVSLKLDLPQSYPPFNGKVSKCFTVRKVWGYGWHQLLRRPFEVSGNAIARLLCLRKGSLVSRYFRLYWSFFASTCLHLVGSLNLPYSDGGWNTIVFFMVQPLAITLEDAMIAMGRGIGFRDSALTHAIGFLWTFLWFSWSLRYGADIQFLSEYHLVDDVLVVFSPTTWWFGEV